MFIPNHDLSLALFQPQIAPNTGNIARLCVATSTPLHLVRPLGFVLSDRQLKRSAMDYWPRLKLTLHDDNDAFLRAHSIDRMYFFDSVGQHSIWDTAFAPDSILVFGSETKGIGPAILRAHPDRVIRIPQVQDERCLNLATAAGIALYEALRQVLNAK